MATEVQQYHKPAYQRRKDGDPSEEIDLNFVHQFVPWEVFKVLYHRNAGTGGTLVITKKLISGSEVVLHTEAAVAVDFVKELNEKLEHGESIRVSTTGAVLAATQFHEVSISWDERQR